MSKVLFVFFLIFFISCSTSSKKRVCPHIQLDKSIKLDDTEKKLICGDKKLEGYRDIPSYQASYYLKGFLQSRGYLEPEFEVKEDILYVKLNKKTYFKSVTVVADRKSESEFVKEEIERLFERKLLTTILLNSIEAEAQSIVRQRGFPCAKVKSEVNTLTGEVTIELQRMAFFNFGEYQREKVEGLRDNALERYYPFTSEQAFNEDLLKLTEKRMSRAEVVQGTYFLEKCAPDLKSFSMEQRFITGPPRTIRFGAGASTEVGPMARVKWSNNRSKSMASLLSATLQASLRTQNFNLFADTFLWADHPRRSILSQLDVTRDSQYDFEQLLVRVKSHYKWTQDVGSRHRIYTLGPTYETGTYNTAEATDTKSFYSGIIEGSMQWMSYPYELFDIHPQEGDILAFNFDYRHPIAGFSDQLLKLDSTYARLSRIMNQGRGTLIGGIRLGAGTSWINDNAGLKGLPPSVKFYGGGSDDIRGYLLKTLPRNDGLGALTKLSMKLELRRTYIWKESIEGFTFVDSAYFGDQSWNVKSQLWYSPGIGTRWLSPIGLVQAYWSRALTLNPSEDNGNFFYAGLGGVF